MAHLPEARLFRGARTARITPKFWPAAQLFQLDSCDAPRDKWPKQCLVFQGWSVEVIGSPVGNQFDRHLCLQGLSARFLVCQPAATGPLENATAQ